MEFTNCHPVLWAEDVSQTVRTALGISIRPTYLQWSESHWLTVVCERSYVSEVVHDRHRTEYTREAMWAAGYVLTARRVFSWRHRYAGEIAKWMTPAEAIASVRASKGSVRYVSPRQFVWVEHPNNPHAKPCTYAAAK